MNREVNRTKATYVNGIMFLASEDYASCEVMDLWDAVLMCYNKGLTHYKSAYRRGYIHRGGKLTINCLVVPYSGRYGVGYALHVESPHTFYHTVEYYTDK